MYRQVPPGPDYLKCPFWKKPMSAVCHTCPLWVCAKGRTGEGVEVDRWECAITQAVMLQAEAVGTLRGVQAATESARNQNSKASAAVASALIQVAQSLPQSPQKLLEVSDEN